MQQLTSWLASPEPDNFPYEGVLDRFHRVGKHFVAKELLAELSDVRALLPEIRGPLDSVRLLARFLDTALDKWDDRYDYPTYLALGLLPLPPVDSEYVACAEWQRDWLIAQLVGDTLRFETQAAEGSTDLFPQMRPDRRTTVKRCRLGLRVLRPLLDRLDLADTVVATDPVQAARQACTAVDAALSDADRRALRLSVLPVYVMHDEYLFLRVLQAFETTFGLLAVQLRSAVRAVLEGEPDTATSRIRAATTELRESAPLFSLLATMQVQSFRTFRNYTEGASAIQSRNYKLVEALCRTPDQERLSSAAYHAVPDIRNRVLAGQPSLDDALTEAVTGRLLKERQQDELVAVMDQFAMDLLRWRQTHYRLAVRMLGDRSGTGYTQGTPYLRQVQKIPVFTNTAPAGSGETGAQPTEGTDDELD